MISKTLLVCFFLLEFQHVLLLECNRPLEEATTRSCEVNCDTTKTCLSESEYTEKEHCACRHDCRRDSTGTCILQWECDYRAKKFHYVFLMNETEFLQKFFSPKCHRPLEMATTRLCEANCNTIIPTCIPKAKEHCLCRNDCARDSTGTCLPIWECRYRAKKRCPETEKWSCSFACKNECSASTCTTDGKCLEGCYCKNNLKRNKLGRCVPENDCSRKVFIEGEITKS